jgi:surface polysaccharide O-acyltransferase-like enzyme
MWYCISYFNPVFIVKFIVFNVPRSSEHLWFLVALIYVYGLHYFIAKWKIKESIYLWIGVVLLAIHLLLGVGLSSIGIVIPICVIRNFLLMGYPFYCIGMLIRKNEDLIHKKFTYGRAIILILIGVIETVISYFICGGNELYIGSVLVAVALFIISLKTKDIRINEKVIKLSQTSTGIYLIHIMVGYSLERIVTADMPMVKNVIPVLVCIISTFVVLLKEKIKETKQSVVYKS